MEARDAQRADLTPDVREAAVALTLTPGEDGRLGVLLIQRATHADDPWSGQMAFPGGRREMADRDLIGTAIREAHEETALEIASENLIGELDDLSPVSKHLPQLVVRPFVFGLPERPHLQDSDEVALHLWVPIESFPASRTASEVTIPQGTLVMPGYRVGPHFVWGMTERILTPFLELVLG